MTKQQKYTELIKRIICLIEGETDEISVMSTIACELFHTFDTFDWVGFYRVTEPQMLKVGPYQGTHGCLQIPFSTGVCGKCAAEKATLIVDDVNQIPYHIACSSSTKSEIVVPIFDGKGGLRAVLDVDSDMIKNFDTIDKTNLEAICALISPVYK